MASYHLSVQIVKRSEGRSVVAMAAYRAGQKLKDVRRGNDADYSRKRGIVYSEIMAPAGSAAWLRDREKLWNAVETTERRKDAQLARELNLALPHEFNDAQRLDLVREFVAAQFVSRGMVADIAIHRPVPERGDDPRNFHAHVLLTLRQAQRDGLRRVKTREWNSDALLEVWRSAWADCQNAALERYGARERVDHRSLLARKVASVSRGDRIDGAVLDRLPEIHVGPKARKAVLARVPQSRDVPVGPVRKDRSGQSVRREVRYRLIDRGSRGECNIARLSANARAFDKAMSLAVKRAGRLRTRLAYYRKLFDGAPKQRSIARQQHVRRRHDQILLLIAELDRLFLKLLGMRESQLVRRTVWTNRLARWRLREISALVGMTGRRRL
jgi:hypothetical protein